jgi:molecular chaperone GrpE
MVKGKGNIFGKKESNTKEEQEVHEDVKTTATTSGDTENMAANAQNEPVNVAEEVIDTPTAQGKEEEQTKQVQEFQDKYLRLLAEFDNFRKRTMKERSELIKSAGEDILVNLLPVLDDFERGLTAMEKTTDVEPVKQGVQLIYNKFKDFLTQRGIREIEANNLDFNVDLHEALTKIPAPTEDLKGKVVDVVQKGYSLNDKVIRYAKVVVGE